MVSMAPGAECLAQRQFDQLPLSSPELCLRATLVMLPPTNTTWKLRLNGLAISCNGDERAYELDLLSQLIIHVTVGSRCADCCAARRGRLLVC